MNREKAFEALSGLDDRYLVESIRYAPENAGAVPERIEHMKAKRIFTFALAAVLLLALSITAYAAYSAVGSPQAAERVAREQIEVWKDMGLLADGVVLEGEARDIYEFEERSGGDYWYGRLFPHHYDVRFYGADRKYTLVLHVDTLSGKLTYLSIEAKAGEDAVPVREETVEMPDEPAQTWYFYDNFEDIFPADMTVDRFCTLLAEYWGFTGYTIADTVDEEYYDAHWEAVDGATPLRELGSDTRVNYYLTVFFDGDQEGAPMYVQLAQFPGRVCMMVGTNHAVG